MLTPEETDKLTRLLSTPTGIAMAADFVKLPAPVQRSVARHVATLVDLMKLMEKSHGYSKRN